ncbi:Uncharacterized protein PCOAH_00025700 [Plasmodium coatneyi]|uniref:Beige/BEACH domain protein n=1 Tax=Plasmodium coatneyi TaxID=208452 RepID=A0A1B1DZU2_9APIC|nr:Uncharacterized protein PCOAH_00025700 [Plasmodium coatneyi]ANQ08303.1 Uncharacterized protein PCOAH_00025700 [Plasmodium coatneyi]
MDKAPARCFNLLFLEEDEEYMDDMMITMRRKQPGGTQELVSTQQMGSAQQLGATPQLVSTRGRLRLCSKSLVFEPHSVEDPVLKFPFKKMENAKIGPLGNEIIIKASEVIRMKTIVHARKTRCTSQFTYDRKNRRMLNVMNNLYNEYYEEIRSIDNENIDEKIPLFERILNNFDENEEGSSSPMVSASNSNIRTAVSGGAGVTGYNSGGTSFVYFFQCDGAPNSAKKLKDVYDIMVRIKVAMVVHEKQMEILIKEKKKKQEVLNVGEEDSAIPMHAQRESRNDKGSVGTSPTSQSGTRNETGSSQPLNNVREIHLEKYIERMMEKLTQNIKFDISSIGLHEKIITNRMEGYWVFKISPLLRTKGLLNITNKFIYFQANPNFTNKKEKKWKTESILHVFKRIIIMKPNALEIIFDHESRKKYSSLYVEFVNFDDREEIISVLKKINPQCFFIEENKDFVYAIQKKWEVGAISNYEYIDFINCLAGRSRKDFSQYPVFPWILCDYSKEELNFSDDSMFRNLKKPVGCLNADRLNSLIEKMQDHDYFYGSHYSTLAYVVYFLIRLHPECQLKLQSGKFDTLSRIFLSIEGTFNTALNANSSFIELIPEFYEDDDNFLKNILNISSNEGNIHDVILPKWCSSAKDFLVKMKNALESNYANKNLNEWINLIFGYKQSGQIAKENFNLFHPLTYMHTILNEKLSTASYKYHRDRIREEEENEFERNFNEKIKSLITTMPSKALKTQLHEFGQCPFQIFKEHHVCRKSSVTFKYREDIKNSPWYYSPVFNQVLRDLYFKRKRRKDLKRRRRLLSRSGLATGGNVSQEDGSDAEEEEDSEDDDDDEMDDDEMDDDEEEEGLREGVVLPDGEEHAQDPLRGKNKRRGIEVSTSLVEERINTKYTRMETHAEYLKKHQWNLHRSDHFPCVVKGVAHNHSNICFVCNNGFIKIITHHDLIRSEMKNNNNLISLKIGEENFSCVTSAKGNYLIGTSNGNVVLLNPQSILKVNEEGSSPKGGAQFDSGGQADVAGPTDATNPTDAGALSDDSSIPLSDSNNSLLSSFEDVFEYDSHMGGKRTKGKQRKKDFLYSANIYNQMITRKLHNDTVNSMSFFDSYLATGSADETVQLLSIERDFHSLQIYDNFTEPVKFVQLRNKLLFTQADGFKLFDIRVPRKKLQLGNLNGKRNNPASVHRSSGKMVPKGGDNALGSGRFFHLYDNEQVRRFYKTIQKVYEQSYISVNYMTPQYLFDKKMKKNMNPTFLKNSNNIIYSSLVNDNTIFTLDRNSNLYFYDIRGENWVNVPSTRSAEPRRRSSFLITASCDDRQQLCAVNTVGDIFFESIHFWNNFDNPVEGDDEGTGMGLTRTNVFTSRCSFTPSYISFINQPDCLGDLAAHNQGDSENGSCNYILLTGANGKMEIHTRDASGANGANGVERFVNGG